MFPLRVAILAAFLFYPYKFLSQAMDKNLYRLPIRMSERACTKVLLSLGK